VTFLAAAPLSKDCQSIRGGLPGSVRTKSQSLVNFAVPLGDQFSYHIVNHANSSRWRDGADDKWSTELHTA